MSRGLDLFKGIGLSLLLVGTPVVFWPLPAAGQIGGPSPSRPSETGTSALSRTLGSTIRPNAPMSFETNRTVATVSPGEISGPAIRRPRTAGQRAGIADGGLGMPMRNSLLGNRVGGSSAYGSPAGGRPGWGRPAAGGGQTALTGGLLLRPPGGQLGGDAPGLSEMSLGTPAAAAPAGESMRNYVVSRRETYLAQGWQRFRERDYRAAVDSFNLAAAVSLDDPVELAECKLGLLHAAVAARQLALAANTVRWFISEDPRTGQIRDPGFLHRMRNVESLYGTRSDYLEHVTHVNNNANHEHASAEVRALRAVVLWGQGDRGRALFHAREMAAPGVPSPWPRLLGLMQRDQPVEIRASGRTGLLVPLPMSAPRDVRGGPTEN